MVGQHPFAFQEYGGVGGVIIRSEAGHTGNVTVTARHPTLGTASASLRVVAVDRPLPLISGAVGASGAGAGS